jgi:hypothetical protein
LNTIQVGVHLYVPGSVTSGTKSAIITAIGTY